ncbi:MAG: transposase, partial [Armatimonadota bacterium]|nr:transposase [Armatimonadota bacterium]
MAVKQKQQKRQTKDSNYDTAWKDAIEHYFPLFMLFFFPAIYAEIDWSRPYEFMDKELQQVNPDSKTGKRLADMLVKVWRKDGQEAFVLVHVEVQNQEQEEFPERMYVYSYRFFDHFHRPVVSLAILGDSNPDWRPSGYGYELWGTRILHDFNWKKLLDYEAQWEMLEKSDNPFALIVMIHLRTLSTQGKAEERLEWKLRIVKGLYERGMAEEDIIQMFRFMDWIMT